MRLSFCVGVALTAMVVAGPARSEAFYKGKTLTILVGLEAGGTVDVFARTFARTLGKYLPADATIIIQNMPGGGGLLATNYLAERAKPDGLTILWGPWDPLAQALKEPTLRARYDTFDFLGGTGDIRVNYSRVDVIPGGLKTPADIAKAANVAVGALNATDPSGLLAHLSLAVLGIRDKMITGYRGGADVFLAMQRNEIQFQNTSIASFRSRGAEFVKSGAAMAISYLVPVDANGGFERKEFIKDMPAFPDLYREIHGKPPSGPVWDATNWLVNQIGEMTFVGFAPRGTPPAAVTELRAAYEQAANDPDFIKQSIAANNIPYTFVDVARGQSIFRSLADVSPPVLDTLRALVGPPQ
jgi:hypothetical protein